MKELFKAVGLLHVEAGLAALLQQAQSQQLTYEAFLQQVLITEKDARHSWPISDDYAWHGFLLPRPWRPLISAFNLASQHAWCRN